MKKLEISLGHNCNAACVFCYSSHTKDKNEMSTKKIKFVLRTYMEKGYKNVAFTGGEPTIRKDIFALISYANKLGYTHITLKTNMFMLYYPSFVEKLEKCGLTNISFSIFGLGDETYLKIAGVKRGFSYLLRALANLKKSKISLTANILVSTYSFEDIVKITELLSNYDIDSFYFLYISTNELGNKCNYLLPPLSSFKKILFSSINLLASSGVKDIRVLQIPPCILENFSKYYYNERMDNITMVDLRSTFKIENESFSDLIKLDRCSLCEKNKVCAGLRKDYNDKFGNLEIIPFHKKKLGKEI